MLTKSAHRMPMPHFDTTNCSNIQSVYGIEFLIRVCNCFLTSITEPWFCGKKLIWKGLAVANINWPIFYCTTLAYVMA